MDETIKGRPTTPTFDPNRFEKGATPEDIEARDRMGTDGPMAHVPKPTPWDHQPTRDDPHDIIRWHGEGGKNFRDE